MLQSELADFDEVSAVALPSAMRRCLSPSLYWKMKERDPPSRKRSPKPGISSSKKIASVLCAGSAAVRTIVAVSFMDSPFVSLGDCCVLGRPWEDFV